MAAAQRPTGALTSMALLKSVSVIVAWMSGTDAKWIFWRTRTIRPSSARYLGITPGALQSATVTIRACHKEQGNAEAYQQALRQVAETAIQTSLA